MTRPLPILLVSCLAVLAIASPPSPPAHVVCPLDGASFGARLPRSAFRAALRPDLRGVRPQATVSCPRCGWVGVASDLRLASPLTAAQRTRQLGWLRLARGVYVRPNPWVLSAELAELAERPPDDTAWRYLQAAETVRGAKERAWLLRRARDLFASTNTGGGSWAAGVLSRRLGEPARAHFRHAVRSDDTPPQLRDWSRAALAEPTTTD